MHSSLHGSQKLSWCVRCTVAWLPMQKNTKMIVHDNDLTCQSSLTHCVIIHLIALFVISFIYMSVNLLN